MEFLGQVTGYFNIGLSDLFTQEEGSKYYEGQLEDLLKYINEYIKKLEDLIKKEVEKLKVCIEG